MVKQELISQTKASAITSAAPGDVGTALTSLTATLTSAETVLSGLSPDLLGLLDPAALTAVTSVSTALGVRTKFNPLIL